MFHGKRHPAEMGATEVTDFLSSLAVQGQVAPATQNQALAALLFLYRRSSSSDTTTASAQARRGCRCIFTFPTTSAWRAGTHPASARRDDWSTADRDDPLAELPEAVVRC